MDSNQKQRERELELRRENEKKDLDVESTIGPRPLEGMSGAHTTWTEEQNDSDRDRQAVHGHDEELSRRRSEEQVEDIPHVEDLPE